MHPKLLNSKRRNTSVMMHSEWLHDYRQDLLLSVIMMVVFKCVQMRVVPEFCCQNINTNSDLQ